MGGYGRMVRDARDAEGMTQAQLADCMGITASVVSRIESEDVPISDEHFRNLMGQLRTLKPVDLLNAMGYPVTVPSPGRIPPSLVAALLRLEPEDLLWVERAARGLAAIRAAEGSR